MNRGKATLSFISSLLIIILKLALVFVSIFIALLGFVAQDHPTTYANLFLPHLSIESEHANNVSHSILIQVARFKLTT